MQVLGPYLRALQPHTLAGRCKCSRVDGCTHTDLVAKTQAQLNQRLAKAQKLPWPKFGAEWYAGCTALIIGNSIKAGVSECCSDKSYQ